MEAEFDFDAWRDSINKAFSAFHAGMEASRQAQLYGVGIVIRDEAGTYTNPEPHTYMLHLPGECGDFGGEKEVDHGKVVMYRVSFEDHEPSYVPPYDYGDSMAQEAIVVQAIYEDGFVVVVKNRYRASDSAL